MLVSMKTENMLCTELQHPYGCYIVLAYFLFWPLLRREVTGDFLIASVVNNVFSERGQFLKERISLRVNSFLKDLPLIKKGHK